MNITFEESIHGCEKIITYDREDVCEDCKGNMSKNGTKFKKCLSCKGNVYIFENNHIIHECPNCINGNIIEEICNICSGTGKELKKNIININIPKGVSSETILKLKNKGNYYRTGYSNLFIRLDVSTNDYFERKNDDVYTIGYIPLSIAILGGQIMIKGLYKNLCVNIPQSSVDNDIIKITGEGFNNGDHYVRIKVVIPKKLNLEQKNIFKEISKYEI